MADDVLVSSTASYTVETEDQGGGIHRQIVGAHIISGGGTGGTSAADDADFTAGTTSGTPAIGVYESSPTSVTDGDLGIVGITQTRELKVSIEADNVGIGGGTQYTEDAAAAANPVGTATALVRADTPAGIASADGDIVAQRGTNYGAAYCQIVDSSGNFIDSFGGSGGTSAADDADFTAGTTQGTPSMGVYESSPTSVTDGDLGTVGITATRQLRTSAVQEGTWNVNNVSGTVSLPTGAATAANQSTANGLLTTIDADTGTISTNSSTIAGDTTSLDSKVTACDTGNVTIASSALPTGAATAANQSTIIGHVDGIETVLGTIDTDTGNIAAGYATEGSALGSGVLIQGDDGTDRTNVLVDTDGHLQVDVLSGGGGGTQYTEGDIDATLTGTIALAEGPSNTATALQVDASSNLQVDIAADSAGLATSANQSTANGLLSTIDADTSALAGTVSGSELQVDVVGALPTGSNTIGNIGTISTSVTPGTGATELGKAEDAVHASGDVGVMALAVRSNTASSKSGSDGDYQPLITNTTGHLWVAQATNTVGGASSIPTGSNTIGSIASIGTSVTPGTGAANLGKAEDAAHASGDTGVMSLAVRTDTPTNRSGADGDYEPLQVSAGRLWASSVVTSISAGSNLIGDVGLSGARTSGGTTIFRSIDLDETEEDVKTSAGQVYWIHAMNLGSSTRFLKFYNATAASVSVGTTTPVLTFPLATQGDTNGAGFTLAIPNGIAFSTAICVAATTGIADSDTGAPGANEVVVNIGYA